MTDEQNTALQYAQKHRAGSDWFGHDPSGAGQENGQKGRGAGKFANKNKDESEDWYHYDAAAIDDTGDAKVEATIPPQMAKLDLTDSYNEGMTHAESHERARKGKGLSENWYSHTNYGDGMTKSERNKATAKQDQKNKAENSEPAGKISSPSTVETKNGSSGGPDWYYHDGHGDKVVSPTRHIKRSNPTPRKENYKEGAWFSHDNLDGKVQNVDGMSSPRVKPEGVKYAERNRGSGNWMVNDGSAALDSPRGKAVCAQKYKDNVGSVLHMQ